MKKTISIIVGVVALIGVSVWIFNPSNETKEKKEAEHPKIVQYHENKTFDKFDYLTLESVKAESIKTNKNILEIKLDEVKSNKVYLVDVYSNEKVKAFDVKNNLIKINYNDVNKLKSRYSLILKEEKLKKIVPNKEEIKIDHGFGIINNNGLELSFNQIYVDYKKEFDLFIKDVNNYRYTLNKKPLKVDENINKLSTTRTKDEVSEKKYNFHYSKSTGYANAALINAKVVDSKCESKISLEENKFCDISYNNKNFNVNVHGNDFEQITRGILFAHTNLAALKVSPIHNIDLISDKKTHIGGAIYSDIDKSHPKLSQISMYGPVKDHNEDQAASAYIDNKFSNGIKSPSKQSVVHVNWLNVALSFFTI